MLNTLINILKGGLLTEGNICPELPEEASGLPQVTSAPCQGAGCQSCATVCPMQAILVSDDELGGVVSLDRGRCIGCQLCLTACPSGTLKPDRATRTAVRSREELVLTNREYVRAVREPPLTFRRSLHVREIATGDSAADLEILASTNSVFDVARFGIHFTASPRFADALLVTGPVGKAMHEPLRRCYNAMAEPRIVIAAGVSAISGGLFAESYSKANGVSDILPISCYIPGDPPHPWSIVYGLLVAMGRM